MDPVAWGLLAVSMLTAVACWVQPVAVNDVATNLHLYDYVPSPIASATARNVAILLQAGHKDTAFGFSALKSIMFFMYLPFLLIFLRASFTPDGVASSVQFGRARLFLAQIVSFSLIYFLFFYPAFFSAETGIFLKVASPEIGLLFYSAFVWASAYIQALVVSNLTKRWSKTKNA